MDRDIAIKEYNELITWFEEQDFNYYILMEPKVSDAEYDRKFIVVKKIETEFPDIISTNSPTQRVGSSNFSNPLDKPLNTPQNEAISTPQSAHKKRKNEAIKKNKVEKKVFEQVSHPSPMLSLDNAMDESELRAFWKRLKKTLRSPLLVAEYKFDGLAVSLHYVDGKLTRALTRGDGNVGEDVTDNIRTISDIPVSINSGEGLVEVRGEILFTKTGFALLNETRAKNGEKTFANARNAASGTLKLHDTAEVKKRPLIFMAYDLLSNNFSSRSHWESLLFLESQGFRISDITEIETEEELVAYYGNVEKDRATLNFEIDGIVFKIDNRDIRDHLGFTNKAPRWAIAAKFKSSEDHTILRDIIIQVGRTGAITPVAILDPVEVGGVVISRATLHNEDEIRRKDIRVGDTVVVRRQGDVIPGIAGVVESKRTGQEKIFEFPEDCPECGSKLVKKAGEAVLRCVNASCPAQCFERIVHFVSRKAMDIDGLGPKQIKQLMDANIIHDIDDIFKINYAQLMNLDRFGERSAKNLLKSIQKAANSVDLHRFIYSLGIRHVGEGTASLIADRTKTLKNFFSLTYDSLINIAGIGEETATSVAKFVADKNERRTVKNLLDNGVSVQKVKEQTKNVDDDHPFFGKLIVVTGSIEGFSRLKLQEKLKKVGASIGSSVTKKTDILIVGDSPGSKLKKAHDNGVRIVEEEEFFNIMGL